MFFSQQELTLIRYFIGVTSVVCLSATLFTFLTFLIDVTRFEQLLIIITNQTKLGAFFKKMFFLVILGFDTLSGRSSFTLYVTSWCR